MDIVKPNKSKLSKEQELQLVSEAAGGDQRAFQKLLSHHILVVHKLIQRHVCRHNHVNYEDCIAGALEGLWIAITKFDPSKDIRLMSYAGWWCVSKAQEARAQITGEDQYDRPRKHQDKYRRKMHSSDFITSCRAPDGKVMDALDVFGQDHSYKSTDRSIDIKQQIEAITEDSETNTIVSMLQNKATNKQIGQAISYSPTSARNRIIKIRNRLGEWL